jgi:hypothetical protein
MQSGLTNAVWRKDPTTASEPLLPPVEEKLAETYLGIFGFIKF